MAVRSKLIHRTASLRHSAGTMTDGVAGAEFTDTRGNNVFAQEDANADNTGAFTARARRWCHTGLRFSVRRHSGCLQTYDARRQPRTCDYANNIIHDVLYQYGFDEAAGNFQENNYGNGGLGGDPVQC